MKFTRVRPMWRCKCGFTDHKDQGCKNCSDGWELGEQVEPSLEERIENIEDYLEALP